MTEESDWMAEQDAEYVGSLVRRTGIAAGLHHRELGQLLGCSRRTVSRWAADGVRLTRDSLAALAQIAHPRDPSLAAEIAQVAGQSLVSLGLELAPQEQPLVSTLQAAPLPSLARLVDAVVCAAAEAMDVPPGAIRPALLSAIRSAREIGLSLEAMEEVLASAAPRRQK